MNKEDLRTFSQELGARAFGVSDLDRLKERFSDLLRLVPGEYSRAIVIGCRLHEEILSEIEDRPTPLYLHHYRQINFQLDRITLQIAEKVQEAGYRALTVPASQVVENRPQKGHVSHRLLGWSAGLGYIGRSGLLISPVFGAHMRYSTVLTDMPLESDQPIDGECGDCHACALVCPAGAIGESSEDFNVKRCHEKLFEFRRMPFIGQNICGVCVKVCGPGK